MTIAVDVLVCLGLIAVAGSREYFQTGSWQSMTLAVLFGFLVGCAFMRMKHG